VVLSAVAIVGLASFLVLRSRRRQIATGLEGIVSKIGVARTDLDPNGKVFVHGELWNARSAGAVETGDRVRILSVDGMTLEVERA